MLFIDFQSEWCPRYRCRRIKEAVGEPLLEFLEPFFFVMIAESLPGRYRRLVVLVHVGRMCRRFRIVVLFHNFWRVFLLRRSLLFCFFFLVSIVFLVGAIVFI